jgi:uncharacterized membrane protein
MKKIIGPGHLAFALAMAGLGVVTLSYGDFALQWQPVPEWVPWRSVLAYLSGIVLLFAGIGLLFRRIAALCALVLSAYLVIFWMLPQAFSVAADPDSLGTWLGFCETLAALSGSWMLYLLATQQDKGKSVQGVESATSVQMARRFFGISCVIFGLSHFVYADITVTMVPAWLPDRLWFAYLTGAGHLAAGLGILFAIWPGMAAHLEALMMTMFVLLVHAPSINSVPPLEWAPSHRFQWTALLWALALAASAWLVATSYRGRMFGLPRELRIGR